MGCRREGRRMKLFPATIKKRKTQHDATERGFPVFAVFLLVALPVACFPSARVRPRRRRNRGRLAGATGKRGGGVAWRGGVKGHESCAPWLPSRRGIGKLAGRQQAGRQGAPYHFMHVVETRPPEGRGMWRRRRTYLPSFGGKRA